MEPVEIIYTLSRLLSGGAARAAKISAAEWPGVAAVAQRHCVSPLLFDALKKMNSLDALPLEARECLERESRAAAARNMMLQHAHAQAAQGAAAAGLPLMPLKGIRYLDFIYKPNQRPLTDADYLIQPEHRLEFKALMQNLGYAQRRNAYTRAFEEAYSGEYHFMRETGGAIVDMELHYELIPMMALRAAYPLNPGQLWKHAVVENGLSIPRIEHDVLFAAVHLAAVHCFSRLIWIADIDRLLRASETFDWDFLWNEAKAARAGRLLTAVLRAVQRYFSTPDIQIQIENKDMRRITDTRVDSWIAGSAGALEIGMVPFLLSGSPARHILGQFFPPPQFVRLRYNIPAWRVPFFYAARPFALAKNAFGARRFEKPDAHLHE